jgi:peptide deformylase
VNIDRPVVLINPAFTWLSDELFELWDDCMSFPNLLVKVKRHKEAVVKYLDEHWNISEWKLHNDMSELLQHEHDHLDGILCTMRAIDEKSFKWKP